MDNAHYHEDILLLWSLHVGLSCCDLVSSLLAFIKDEVWGGYGNGRLIFRNWIPFTFSMDLPAVL